MARGKTHGRIKKTTTGGAAVMNHRAAAPAEEEFAQDPVRALHRRLDYFPTPPWATRAGSELLRALDPEAAVICEPACGEGHMAEVLRESFPCVGASDIHAHRPGMLVLDWLDEAAWPDAFCDWVVTNPPFVVAEDFVRLGRRRARRGVALLLRLNFLEGVGRWPLFCGETPLTKVATFCQRVPMTLGSWDPDASSATPYAWFFWKWGAEPQAPAWIAPGTRERLWRPDDAQRFARPSDAMPLFAGIARGEA